MNMAEYSIHFRRGDQLSEAELVKAVWEQNHGIAEESEEDQPLDLRGIEKRNTTDMDLESNLSSERDLDERKEESCSTEFIDEMMDRINMDLTTEQKFKVRKLLEERKSAFSMSEFDLGRTEIVRHTIDTGNARPF